MDPPTNAADPADQVGNTTAGVTAGPAVASTRERRDSSSQQSETSQTAAEFIRDQMQMEADAREALPYSIENCTKPLGPLRQSVFACLTCNPPPASASEPYNAAGVCYACSVQCHGEHVLVELFNKRNFSCDCGTTRLPATSPCTLRINPDTNTKGGVRSETPDPGNKYNQNFRNRFCGCECDYDPFEQKGTMFQCLGLGTHETGGGCGEDWWHPGCVVGLGPRWFENMGGKRKSTGHGAITTNGTLATISEDAEPAQGESAPAPAEEEEEEEDDDDDDPPMPPGFPAEDDFEGFICYKCVDAYPWIRRYAGTPAFLPAVYSTREEADKGAMSSTTATTTVEAENASSTKRRAEDDGEESREKKRVKSESEPSQEAQAAPSESVEEKEGPETDYSKPSCRLASLPPAPEGQFSLFFAASFRDNLCRCTACFPHLKAHPQLLEEEETYEPPISDDGGSDAGGGSTHGSGSLYERGESALRNVDRVRAIEGVMAYNHLKEQLTPFFKQFAESGRAIGAEDIKEYFAKLRGDAEAIKEAGESAGTSDHRQEQSGY